MKNLSLKKPNWQSSHQKISQAQSKDSSGDLLVIVVTEKKRNSREYTENDQAWRNVPWTSMSSGTVESSLIKELKEKKYTLGEKGTQADMYTWTMKAIGEYVGQVYGKEMKTLVLQLLECGLTEPNYPDNGNEKQKAIWSKEYDQYLKKSEWYQDYKAKVFMIVMGQCTKLMKNWVEGMNGYNVLEKDSDVIGLLQVVKDVAFDSNEKWYPHLQACSAWKQLMLAQQQDKEDLIDYYKRFMSLVEVVERSYG